MCKAIGSSLEQWPRIIRCFDAPKLRLARNLFEDVRPVIAPTSEDFPRLGHDGASANLADLQKIGATCAGTGVDP